MQLLFRNNRFRARNPCVNATLQLWILRYLKPVTGNHVSTPDEAELSASITKEVNQLVERAIASNRHAPDNGAKGKYDRQICSWEWQCCSFRRFKASHDIGESTVRLFKKCYRPPYKNRSRMVEVGFRGLGAGFSNTQFYTDCLATPFRVSRRITRPYKNCGVGVVKHSTYKTQLLNSQSTLKPGNAIILLRI